MVHSTSAASSTLDASHPAINAGSPPDALAPHLGDLERDLGELLAGLAGAGVESQRVFEPIAS